MRLEKIQNVLKEKNWGYQYTEEDGCGSIDFEYRGVSYHIWEFFDGIWGAETNVKNGGSSEDIVGEYEEAILKEIRELEVRKRGIEMTEGWSKKIYVELLPPTEDDNRSDSERILDGLKREKI